MDRNRVKSSILNSFFASFSQLINIVIKFIVQSFFIHTLGTLYLGTNGLFVNVLGVLSFFDLGISVAITFSLYQPLSDHNSELINEIMVFFKKAYTVIGCLVLFFGLVLIPFLPFMIKGQKIPFLQLCFIIFLLNSVAGYFFSYKISLLTADQFGYQNSINQTIFSVIQSTLQIVTLVFYQSFILYLVIQLVCTVSSNIAITLYINQKYSFLKKKTKGKIPKDVFQSIKYNTLGMIASKFGGIALFASDNIIISAFIGIYYVGLYSNYLLITNAIANLLSQIVTSVSSSVGDFFVKNDQPLERYRLLKRHLFVTFALTYFCSILLACLLNPFITFWIGSKFTFSTVLVDLIAINFLLTEIRQSPITFITASGLFSKTAIKSIIEAFINIGISLVLVLILKMGVEGVILGTIVSNVFVNLWYEPLVVIKFSININKYFDFFFNYFIYIMFTIIVMLASNYLVNQINFPGFWGLVIDLLVALVFSGLLFVICFHQKEEFRYVTAILKNVFLRFFN